MFCSLDHPTVDNDKTEMVSSLQLSIGSHRVPVSQLFPWHESIYTLASPLRMTVMVASTTCGHHDLNPERAKVEFDVTNRRSLSLRMQYLHVKGS